MTVTDKTYTPIGLARESLYLFTSIPKGQCSEFGLAEKEKKIKNNNKHDCAPRV